MIIHIQIHIQTVCKARGGKRLLFVITNIMLYLLCRVILAADMNCCSTMLLVFCTRERPRLKGDKLYERKTFGALGH